MGLLNTIFGSNSTTSFFQLYNKLRDWNSNKVYPYEYNLPKEITFPKDFWKKIVDLNKQTLTDGNERAVSIYWADGDLVFTPVIRGNEKSVTSNSNISVKYSQHPTKKEYARKEVLLNNSVYKRSDIYYKKIPKKIEVSYLFNIHTHPQHIDSNGNGYYNYFSAQDIKALIYSNAVISGLITDKLWLIFRTSNTPDSVSNISDQDMNIEYINNTLHIGVYCGSFNNTLLRQLPATTSTTTSTTS